MRIKSHRKFHGEGEGAMAASATETEIDGYVIRTYVCWVKD